MFKATPKKGWNIDPYPCLADFPSNKVTAQFNHQYYYSSEHLDQSFLEPLCDELASTIFADANHSHDSVTGKAILGFLCFVVNIPTYCGAPRQALSQTSTHGAEMSDFKLAVEHDVAIRYHIQSMRLKVNYTTTMHCDNKAVVTNTTEAWRILSKKYLSLAHRFYR